MDNIYTAEVVSEHFTISPICIPHRQNMQDVVVAAKQHVKVNISGNIVRWWDLQKLVEEVGVQYLYLTNVDLKRYCCILME